MAHRKTPLVNENIYHVFTRSISDFKIFRSKRDFCRIKDTVLFYSVKKPEYKFSVFENLSNESKQNAAKRIKDKEKIVDILAYCIMPTHVHFILKQLKDKGISRFMNSVLKSYSRYFNIKYNRLGPLCDGRFKNIIIDKDDYLLHLTRYIHLNPVSGSLVSKPQEWGYSSYKEYIGVEPENERICEFGDILGLSPQKYMEFVEERIDYQKELEAIKHLVIE